MLAARFDFQPKALYPDKRLKKRQALLVSVSL
jgi:hypothetical protein